MIRAREKESFDMKGECLNCARPLEEIEIESLDESSRRL